MRPKAEGEPKHLYVPTREEWRAWLQEHHARETEVWLVYPKKHTGKPRVSYDDAVEEALCFGWIDSIARRLDEDRYAQKFTPRRDTGNWSASNLKRMERLIAEGRMTPAGLAKFKPVAQPPRYQSDSALPPFVEGALKENEAAYRNFQGLPPSHRRNYVRWITEAKKEETRQRRLQEALRLLENNQKLGI
ncbi:MAG TPA: YdeI/OmpD-associated family protein [Thermoanaerobaculia bacterium]|jgi:uncharacterized protein YdeI (YjbR/CyaY-like superfamily)|nr:YdeI/OmpD-associated family protein [Thermoanaerobaculia bacterium]